MNKKIMIIFSFIFVVIIFSLNTEGSSPKDALPNAIIIKYKDDVVADNELKNEVESVIDEDVKTVDTLNDNSNVGDIVEVKTDKKINIDDAIEKLEDNSAVEYAQPNYRYKASAVNKSWDCKSYSASPWHLSSSYLNASSAKNQLVGKDSVEVGVIDSGVDKNHSEIKANYNASKSYDFVANKKATVDGNGHGTHVAGTVAGKNVGAGSNIKIVDYRVLDSGGYGYTSDIVKALSKANRDGVKVVNLSLGGYIHDPLLYGAVAKYNGIVVAAAGNEGYAKSIYPAGYNLDNVISVGSIDSGKGKSDFSNYNGTSVDVSTYGRCIYSSTRYYELNLNNGKLNFYDYAIWSGTSMATPSVTASVAMNYAYNKGLSNQQLKASIMDSSVYSSKLSGKNASAGYLDLNRGLDIVKSANTNSTNPRKKARHSATLSASAFTLTGDNTYGQLGTGGAQPFTASNISKYYLTLKNTYVITKDGKLYVAGANDMGQLGKPSLKNSNKFIEFRKVVSSHKFIGMDFRNSKGMYDENSIYIYLNYGRNAQYYKLGTNSFKANSTGLKTTKNIQLVQKESNQKAAIKYYAGSNNYLSAQEKYTYNSSTKAVASKSIYFYYSGYNRKFYYAYKPTLKKYYKLDTYKNGKRKFYEERNYRITRKYNKSTYQYKYSSKIAIRDLRQYKGGKISARAKYNYNKYGKLAYYKKSNAKYTFTRYSSGLATNSKTYYYNSKGKKVLRFVRKNYYSKGKMKLKKEYLYNKKGKLRSNSAGNAYYYRTTYKKGKAKKTYRYQYNNKGKLTNKKAVKTRR